MLKHLLSCAIAILLICNLTLAGDRRNPGRIAPRAIQAEINTDMTRSNTAAPSVLPPSQTRHVEKVTAVQGTATKIGVTDYDWEMNSGGTQSLRVFNGKIHFTYVYRSGASTNRQQKYAYYDPTTSTLSTAIPNGTATSASSYGSVDVFFGGPADGIGLVAWGSPSPYMCYTAMDAGPGACSFTNSTMIKASLDIEAVIDNKTQTIWASTNGSARTDYYIFKSSDYGSTWTLSDSLVKYLPKKGMAVGGLDNPMIIAPNGNLAFVTTVYGVGGSAGVGNIPPIGTANPDSARRIGYFLSTNQGTSWTWKDIGIGGQKIVAAPGDTIYTLFANFSQYSSMYDKNNKLHIVANGYSYKYLKPSNRNWLGTYFAVMFWDESTGIWKSVSRPVDAAPQYDDTTSIWDYTNYTYKRAYNAFGFCYPNLAIDTASGVLFAGWEQPRYIAGTVPTGTTPARLDTNWSGYVQYDYWYNISYDGGTTWTGAQKLANSYNAFMPVANKYLTKSGNTLSAYVAYMADTAGGCSLGTATTGLRSAVIPVDWVYQKIDFAATGVAGETNRPNTFALDQNYPNPFNPSTNFRFTLPMASEVRLSVFNILGQEVATVVNTSLTAGEHTYNFDASNLSSGVYFYRLTADKFTATKKMMLMK
jgi:hypothetical protein